MTEPWEHLKDGAAQLAYVRLAGLHQLATGAVNQFHRDAYAQTETLRGESPSDFGGELFKTLTNLVWVCFPEAALLDKLVDEAFKAARDAAVSMSSSYAAQSSQQRLDNAKDELRQKLNDLAAATDETFKAAWFRGNAAVPGALSDFFERHPEYKRLPYDGSATQTQAWICDQIGIQDFAVHNPSATITAQLWAAFAREIGRASAKIKFFDMDNDVERLIYLLKDVEPQRNVADFLAVIGADVDYWMRLVRRYHEEHPGEEPTAWNVLQLVSAS